MRRAAAALACLALAGCSSVLFMERLPRHYSGDDPPHCTTSVLHPATDALFGLGVLTGALAIAMDDQSETPVRAGLGLTIGAVGVAFLGGAKWGLDQTTRCSRARAEWDARGE